jgi:hypothetical protein
MNVPESPDQVWSDEIWLDEDAGPVVRHYAMTSGRTRPTRGEFDLITLIMATRDGVRRGRRAAARVVSDHSVVSESRLGG